MGIRWDDPEPLVVPWDDWSRDRWRFLAKFALGCLLLVAIVTWGFDQAEKDLRIENPSAPTEETDDG